MKASELPRGFRYQSKSVIRHGALEHRFWFEGELGAVEFWVRQNSRPDPAESKWYGGFETHRTDGDGVPDHPRCPMLSDRPCWHDGSSLYAEEHWIPLFESVGINPEFFWSELLIEYRKRFEPAGQEASDG